MDRVKLGLRIGSGLVRVRVKVMIELGSRIWLS